MRKHLIVVKIGGSALTDKRKIYKARMRTIIAVSKQIAALAKQFRIVLVHGAGSYGHIPVMKYGLDKGFKNPTQLTGLAKTKLRLLEWEYILTTALADAHIPIMPLLPSSNIVARNGRIISLDTTQLENWLKLGCVPIMGGDIVSDTALGFSVISGDQLAVSCARHLKASKLIFGTDVDGIFDSNPKKEPKARLLKHLTITSATQLLSKSWKTTEPDVTGGMSGKLIEALGAARAGIPVVFVNLTKNQRLRDAALGLEVRCTRITP